LPLCLKTHLWRIATAPQDLHRRHVALALPFAQVGKETGGKKLEAPHALKANEMAQVTFEPCQPLVVDSFKNCEGLSRIAFLDGNTAVMLGKVVSTTAK
jgi:translation elongation factor EF-1alpha